MIPGEEDADWCSDARKPKLYHDPIIPFAGLRSYLKLTR